MADDIDIEEHDILENPAIRHVFPDISVVKQEIDNYEKGLDVDSLLSIENENKVVSPSTNACIQYLNAGNVSQLKITEVVGAGVNDIVLSPFLRTEKALIGNRFACNNLIVLGTESVSNDQMDYEEYETQVNCVKSKVVLTDVKSYLENTERYCAECKILFSRTCFFDVHMKTAHDNLVNNTEANANLKQNNERICLRYKCKLCLKIFPEKGINQHLLSHKDCKIMLNKLQDNGVTNKSAFRTGNICSMSAEEETKLRQKYLKVQSIASGNQNEFLYKCYICTFYFVTQKKYIDHLLKKHGIVKNPESIENCQNYDGLCQFCGSSFTLMSRYNAHIYYKHGKMYSKADQGTNATIATDIFRQIQSKGAKQSPVSLETTSDYYRCYICTQYFSFKIPFIQHMEKSHRVPEDKIPLKFYPFRDMCFFCRRLYRNTKTYNRHIYYSHREFVKKCLNSEDVNYLDEHFDNKLSKLQSVLAYVHKHLYRCYVCTCYFRTIDIASRHLNIVHDIQVNTVLLKSDFHSQCKFCPKKCKNIVKYNFHLKKEHKDMFRKKIEKAQVSYYQKTFQQFSKSLHHIQKSEKNNSYDTNFFRCFICSFYFVLKANIVNHLNFKHHIQDIPINHKRLSYDGKCWFCSRVQQTFSQYNEHLRKSHSEIINNKVDAKTAKSLYEKFEKAMSKYVYEEDEAPKCFNEISHNKQLDKIEDDSEDNFSEETCDENEELPIIAENDKCNDDKTLTKYEKKFYYKCYICSMYFWSADTLNTHLEKRHSQNEQHDSFEKVDFDPCCKFCDANFSAAHAYNSHVHKEHYIKFISINNKGIQEHKTDTSTKDCNYYRCTICTHYCKNSISMMEHITQEHDTNVEKYEKVNFNPFCKFCCESQKNIDVYNSHLLSCSCRPKTNRLNDNAQLVFEDQTKDFLQNMDCSDYDSVTSTKDFKCYRCYVCAYHTNEFDCYHTHLAVEHSINDKYKFQIPKMVKSRFVKKGVTIESIQKNLDGIVPFLLKSGLFQCKQCDVCFLSAEIALNHTNHVTIADNWDCSICKRILKKEDSILHEKQHELSQDFKVYVIPPQPPSLVLYKCVKCAIHFTEDNFIIHQINCEDQDCNSAYCKICDILVDDADGTSHEADHLKRNLKPTDVIIVETEVITDYDFFSTTHRLSFGNTSTVSFENLQKKPEFTTHSCLFYCDFCKCFLTSSERSYHSSSRCNYIKKRIICGICGVIFDKRFSEEHKNLHTEFRLYRLQEFKFYTIDGKVISPPIPEYLKCGKCKVLFWNKIDISKHSCNKIDYLSCSECEIKLTVSAFKLHMAFHNYSFESKIEDGISNQLITDDSSQDDTTDDSVSDTSVKEDDVTNCKPPFNEIETPKILYKCKACRVIMTTYDKVVEHCQRHYISQATHREVMLCEICSLIFDKECYQSHKGIHENFGSKCIFSLLCFDLFYFTAENCIWIKHLFKNISQLKIDEILNKSIYKYEQRIHMEVIHDGPSHLTVYMCERCQSCIDEVNLYKHADNSCFKLRKHNCSICGLPFISSNAREVHEKKHSGSESDVVTFRIVYFNQSKDKELNKVLSFRSNHYTMFQCRTCNGAMDQSQSMMHMCDVSSLRGCFECGLLFNKDYFNQHLLRHKELPKFTSKNMKVILFGEGSDTTSNEAPVKVSLYKGSIFDYTFYCCVNCEICSSANSSTLTHSCTYGKTRLKCPDCQLHFSLIEFKMHCKLHETDLDFVRRNMRLITFGSIKKRSLPELEDGTSVSTTQSTEETPSFDGMPLDGEKIERPKQNGDSQTAGNGIQKIINVYKCNCGVHFFSQDSMSKHHATCSPKERTPRQKCSKCNLLFTPNILFNHMILHHGDLKLNYKFNIITSDVGI